MSNEWHEDGLEIPEVGPWAKRKYHFLARYLHLFSTGMKNKWPQRHYIDLFAGAGAARIKDTSELVKSSALLAATTQDPFTALHLCDSSSKNTSTLQKRIQKTDVSARTYIETGDANKIIAKILSRVPDQGSLCLTFVDPFGLHFDFETARAVARKQSDLIILLADNMDALRNWNKYYWDNPDSALDRFIGEPGWRDIFLKESHERRASALRDKYLSQLQTLGYSHFGHERVSNSGGRDIYTLVYASRSAVGLKFWEKAASVDEGGQTTFNFN